MAKRKNPHAVALGKLGGKVVTEKKIAHLRSIAKSGGRKQKFLPDDRVMIADEAPLSLRGKKAYIVGFVGRARYLVRIADGTEHVLYSWWLRADAPKAR